MKFNWSDYLVVWLIVLVTVVSEMIYGVIFGVIIALILYMLGGISGRAVSDRDIDEKHALLRLSEIDGGWTKVIRPQVDKIKLRGLEDLVMIAKVAKFLFFGSLCELQIAISNWLDEREHRLPPCRRAKYLVLDLSDIDALDPRLASKSAMEEIVSIVKQVHERGVQAVLAGFDPFDPTNPCHRIPVIASLDTNVKWVWCGDLGCNAALEARYRAYNTAALDAIEAPVRLSQAGIARRGSTTKAPSAYELVRAAIAASKPGPTSSDGVALSDGHLRVVPSRELQVRFL